MNLRLVRYGRAFGLFAGFKGYESVDARRSARSQRPYSAAASTTQVKIVYSRRPEPTVLAGKTRQLAIDSSDGKGGRCRRLSLGAILKHPLVPYHLHGRRSKTQERCDIAAERCYATVARAARGARQLAPRVRQAAFRDAYLVRSRQKNIRVCNALPVLDCGVRGRYRPPRRARRRARSRRFASPGATGKTTFSSDRRETRHRRDSTDHRRPKTQAHVKASPSRPRSAL